MFLSSPNARIYLTHTNFSRKKNLIIYSSKLIGEILHVYSTSLLEFKALSLRREI